MSLPGGIDWSVGITKFFPRVNIKWICKKKGKKKKKALMKVANVKGLLSFPHFKRLLAGRGRHKKSISAFW